MTRKPESVTDVIADIQTHHALIAITIEAFLSRIIEAHDREIAELKARDRALSSCNCDRHSGGGSDVILVCHDCGGYFP